jgi:hypothetical protein
MNFDIVKDFTLPLLQLEGLAVTFSIIKDFALTATPA